jgi:hypothetical protein
MTTLVRILLSILLLTTGRKLYWLFVGIIGFVAGLGLATLLFTSESEIALLAIALVAGVFGAISATFLQRVAVSIAGFIAGGYITAHVISLFGVASGIPIWIPFLIGGCISAMLVAVLFDPALILLSSLTGASLLTNTLDVNQWVSLAIFFIALATGIAVQVATMRNDRI